MARLRRALALSAAALVVGCGGGHGAPDGTEGGKCFGNGTCDDGLSCDSSLCVRVGDAGATTGAAGATEPDARAADAGHPDDAAIEVTPSVCGNGVVEGDELCDDGKVTATCSATCQIVPQVVTGTGHSCALGKTGQVQCWGDDSLHQIDVPPSLLFKQIDAGAWHNCGVTTAGTVQCWGDNGSRQSSPAEGAFQWVAAGTYHTCGLRTTGELACWGKGTTTSNCDPDERVYECGQSAPPGGRYVALAAGSFHNCALYTAGVITCWGDNHFAQSTPPTAAGFTAISAGASHTCALDAAGQLSCWGDASTVTGFPPDVPMRLVAAGITHSCAVAVAGDIQCWGSDLLHQLEAPTLAAGELVTSIDSGRGHSCAIIDAAGSLRIACWGAGVTRSPCDLTMAEYQCGQSAPPLGAP